MTWFLVVRNGKETPLRSVAFGAAGEHDKALGGMKRMNGFTVVCRSASLAISWFIGSADGSVISRLYMTAGINTNGRGVIFQGDSIVGTFATGVNAETGIAVRDTIRIINGPIDIGAGSEYDLNGNVLNSGIYLNTSFVSLWDGTTDGQFNYAIDHNGNGFNQVFRFDLNWANPVPLFNTMQGRGQGITYDAETNTLWTTGGPMIPNGPIQQYSMTGTLLSSFENTTAGINGSLGIALGIAWDPADDTLWISDSESSKIHQFSKMGILLASIDVGLVNTEPQGQPNTILYGMEFSITGDAPGTVIPEPTTVAIWSLLGGIGLVVGHRRRRKAA